MNRRKEERKERKEGGKKRKQEKERKESSREQLTEGMDRMKGTEILWSGEVVFAQT